MGATTAIPPLRSLLLVVLSGALLVAAGCGGGNQAQSATTARSPLPPPVRAARGGTRSSAAHSAAPPPRVRFAEFTARADLACQAARRDAHVAPLPQRGSNLPVPRSARALRRYAQRGFAIARSTAGALRKVQPDSGSRRAAVNRLIAAYDAVAAAYERAAVDLPGHGPPASALHALEASVSMDALVARLPACALAVSTRVPRGP